MQAAHLVALIYITNMSAVEEC